MTGSLSPYERSPSIRPPGADHDALGERDHVALDRAVHPHGALTATRSRSRARRRTLPSIDDHVVDRLAPRDLDVAR